MLNTFLGKIIGTQNERELKRLRPLVGQINDLEASLQPLSDADLRAKTVEFKQRLAEGATLGDLLPEAFAVVREGGRAEHAAL
jgi:preprotein translocase subunit SecA